MENELSRLVEGVVLLSRMLVTFFLFRIAVELYNHGGSAFNTLAAKTVSKIGEIGDELKEI